MQRGRHTFDLFCNLLLDLSNGERQIEIIRQILCEQDLFEPYAAFKRIDRHKKGYIDNEDIYNFLRDNDITYSKKVCNYFICRYDKDADDKLTYQEFLRAVLTMNNQNLRATTSQRPTYDLEDDEYLPYDVEYSLVKLIEKEINFNVELDPKKQELGLREDFNVSTLFFVIDSNKASFIDFESIKTFMKSRKFNPLEDEILSIVRRISKKDDGKITLHEFSKALEPMDPALRFQLQMIPKKPAASPIRDVTPQNELNKKGNNCVALSNKKSLSPNLKSSLSPTNDKTPSKISFKTRYDTPGSSHKNSNSSHNYSNSSFIKPKTPNSNNLTKGYGRTDAEASSELQNEKHFLGTPIIDSDIKKNVSNRKSTSASKRVYNDSRSNMKSQIPRTEKSLMDSIEKPASRIEFSTKSSPVNNSKYSPLFTSQKKTTLESTKESEYSSNQQKSPLRTIKYPGTNGIKNVQNFQKQEAIEYDNLLYILKKFTIMEKDLEIAKQDLALRPDFNTKDLFRIFDFHNNGVVSASQFMEGLRFFEINPTFEELKLILLKYDNDEDGLLSFDDMVKIYAPRQPEYATLVNNRLAINDKREFYIENIFSTETKKHISQVSKILIDNEIVTESLRNKYQSTRNITQDEAFKYLDFNQDGYINFDDSIDWIYSHIIPWINNIAIITTSLFVISSYFNMLPLSYKLTIINVQELRNIFDKHEIIITDKDTKLLLEKFDQDQDSLISYDEFLKEITPKKSL